MSALRLETTALVLGQTIADTCLEAARSERRRGEGGYKHPPHPSMSSSSPLATQSLHSSHPHSSQIQCRPHSPASAPAATAASTEAVSRDDRGADGQKRASGVLSRSGSRAASAIARLRSSAAGNSISALRWSRLEPAATPIAPSSASILLATHVWAEPHSAQLYPLATCDLLVDSTVSM